MAAGAMAIERTDGRLTAEFPTTSFNNAFERWTGRSASAARKEQQRPKVEPDSPPH